jgi:hypothetical protein
MSFEQEDRAQASWLYTLYVGETMARLQQPSCAIDAFT